MKQAKTGILQKVWSIVNRKIFGFTEEVLPILKLIKRQTEIKCVPTYWIYLNGEHQRITNWPTTEIIKLIDSKKVTDLIAEHKKAEDVYVDNEYEDKEVYWNKVTKIQNHITKNHFEDIKLDIPTKHVVADVASSGMTIGVENILTKEKSIYRIPRYVVTGDVLITQIGTIEWDIVNELLKQELA